MPSTSSLAAEILATASATGMRSGIAWRASSVGTCSFGITTTASTPCGGPRPGGGTAPVRVPLHLRGPRNDVLRLLGELVEVVGGEQAGHNRGGARAEARSKRDLAPDPEGDPVGGPERLERAHTEVGAIHRHVEPRGLDREGSRLLH